MSQGAAPWRRRAALLRGASSGMHVHGLFARLANGLFMHWPKPCHQTTTDFADAMSADQAHHVLRMVTACQSKLAAAS